MALWLVRAGSRGEGEDYALQNNVVGIGWADLGDLSAARSLDAIKQHLQVFPNSDS
jgi:restriction system protein